MADSLAAFLLACLDDDAREAQAAFSNQADPEHGWGADGRAVTPHVGVIHEDVQRAHVVKWDPARVLAEVQAKRDLLTMHSHDEGHECPSLGDPGHTILADAGRDCPTLLLLAQPYRDREGFRDDWRMGS